MSEQDNHAGWISFWVYVTAVAVSLIAFTVTSTAYDAKIEGRSHVGRSVGFAVVEQYDTSWVTTDPSWNPLVDGCLHDCGAP